MIFHDGNRLEYCFETRLADLLDSLPADSLVLIDIPLGLGSPELPRTVEKELRKRVPGRGSTVFNVPCRAAVYADDKAEARRLNTDETGKSLSEQSLNICPKIREADIWLRSRIDGNEVLRLYESHPETAFAALKGDVLLSNKSQSGGREERLNLLKASDGELDRLYEFILKETKRKDLKPDDILDAAALCRIALLSEKKGLCFIRDENDQDEFGIEIQIACLESGKNEIES